MAYSLPPARNIVRVTETSAVPSPIAPSELSNVSTTSARPSGARVAVPAKMTSAMLPPRSERAPCSPSTQAMASTTLDLPEPFGPTTHVIPGSRRSVVAEANDLNPRRVSEDRYTGPRVVAGGDRGPGCAAAAGAYASPVVSDELVRVVVADRRGARPPGGPRPAARGRPRHHRRAVRGDRRARPRRPPRGVPPRGPHPVAGRA